MVNDELSRVREHIERILTGRGSLTPEDVRAGAEDAGGELSETLATLSVLEAQLIARSKALADREQWFSRVLAATDVGVWECNLESVRASLDDPVTAKRLDTDGDLVRDLAERLRLVSVSDSALSMFGAANRGMLDACLDEVVRDDAVALFRSIFRGLVTGDLPTRVEGTVYNLDGDPLPVAVAAILGEAAAGEAVAGEAAMQLTLAWTDLSSHDGRIAAEKAATQQSKELERVNKDVERLFRAISHDLRAPLRAVLNLADWALEDLGADNAAEVPGHLTALRGRVVRLEKMLADLLSYARLGRAEHAYESVDVAALLEETKGMLEWPDGFQLTWGKHMPEVVTQRTLLAQVFLNLIGNAIKHHDGKEPGHITVSALDQDSFVLFKVADNGPGIAEQDRARVFGLFTTLRRRDEVEGSGMGLAFVQKVVKTLGGEIGIGAISSVSQKAGTDGRGSSFEFTWPKGPTARRQKKSRPPTLIGLKLDRGGQK